MSAAQITASDDRRLDWKSVLLMALLLPVLLSLGFWQLERADDKRAILAEYAERRDSAPRWLGELSEVENFQPVMVKGQYDQQRYWLLDNRIRQGRFGYEVVALLSTDGGDQLLVNRGWVAGDPGRRTLPAVTLPIGEQLLSGEVYMPRGAALDLAAQQGDGRWPRVVQWLDMPELEDEFGEKLLPYTVRLEPVAANVVNVSPAKHVGYAVQWFCMALVLTLFFIWRNTRLFSRRKLDERKD